MNSKFKVVLAKSPTLKAAMRQSEVRCLPEAVLVFPEFKKRSIVMLLQFLYTGEVGKKQNSVIREFSFFILLASFQI